ncbi:hypothetical protein CFP56_035379 [Quercus suber]|uniref:Uncharacterized protein n=1 Tax=Quercus suber TaxID=58331 RepID=A0AAW0JA54_QUESU
MPELLTTGALIAASDKVSKVEVICRTFSQKRKHIGKPNKPYPTDLNLCLTQAKVLVYKPEIRRLATPSMNSKESVTIFESGFAF